MRYVFLLNATLFAVTLVQAQTTKEGYALEWKNTLTVMPDTLLNGKHKLAAFTIPVFESDGNAVLDLWKADMKASSQQVTGSKPMKAMGTMQPTVAEGPILILANSMTDKKAGLGKLTLAFAKNDSVGVDQQVAARQVMQQLAVKYNKAVVQAQITTKEKTLGKATEKVTDAQADARKFDQKVARSNGELKKNKVKQGKIQVENARSSGEIAGFEKKFSMTNNPKDLQKLIKLRTRLAKSETGLAKLMGSEAKLQSTLNKYQGDKPDTIQEQNERAETKDEVMQEIEALKRKLDNIR